MLELKSNIKQSNADSVFAKPLPPSSDASQAARGVKRSHDVGAYLRSVSHLPIDIDLFSPVANASEPSAAVPSATHSALPAGELRTNLVAKA